MRKFTSLLASALILGSALASYAQESTTTITTARELEGNYVTTFDGPFGLRLSTNYYNAITWDEEEWFYILGALGYGPKNISLSGVFHPEDQEVWFNLGKVGTLYNDDYMLYDTSVSPENVLSIDKDVNLWKFKMVDGGGFRTDQTVTLWVKSASDGSEYIYRNMAANAEYFFGKAEWKKINAYIKYKVTMDKGLSWVDVQVPIRADFYERDGKNYFSITKTIDYAYGNVCEFELAEDGTLTATDQYAQTQMGVDFMLVSKEGDKREKKLTGKVSDDHQTITFGGIYEDGFWQPYSFEPFNITNPNLHGFWEGDNYWHLPATIEFIKDPQKIWYAGAFNDWQFDYIIVNNQEKATLKDLIFTKDDLGFKFSTTAPVGNTIEEKWAAFNEGALQAEEELIDREPIPFIEGTENSTVPFPGFWNLTFDMKEQTVMGVGKSSLHTIEAAETDATPVYYNLQGIQVKNPTQGQVVIRVKGNEINKMVF